MGIKDLLKEKLSNSPAAKKRRSDMRSALENKDITFLCPNCIGGILFHDLGLRFLSPTVNLMLTQTDFLKLVLDLDHYLSEQLVFFDDPNITCPCAFLDDIVITFTHFKTEDEARTKWTERAKRINRENLFIFIEERDGLTYEDMKKLETISSVRPKGILAFTARSYPDLPFALQIHKYEKDGEVGNILEKNYFNDSREYEKFFDFVKWFNEASGPDYNIKPFIKQYYQRK